MVNVKMFLWQMGRCFHGKCEDISIVNGKTFLW